MEETSVSKLVNLFDDMSYEQIPPDILKLTKEYVADFIGIFCASTKKSMSRQLHEALKDKLGEKPVAEELAMWMASSARMLDMDDAKENKEILKKSIYGCGTLGLIGFYICEKLEERLNEVVKNLEESMEN